MNRVVLTLGNEARNVGEVKHQGLLVDNHELQSIADSFLRSPTPETISPLLDSGVGVNATDREGDTPLHLVAKASEPWHQPPTVNAVRLLLTFGAEITTINDNGATTCVVASLDDENTRALLCP